MKGIVYKIHSDFYYVKPEGGTEAYECKLREVLKKQKLKIKAGDFVEIEKGAIIKLYDRINTLTRPSVSNLDKVVVVSSLLEPKIDFIQLNRYLIFLKYHKIPAMLCFNKDDLLDKDDFEQIKNKIEKIYKPLNYEIVFTSALYNDGLDRFKKSIQGKTICFCGLSGVGKSSILNALQNASNRRTSNVSKKLKRGRHTTRHCEIIDFDDFKIIDTPGFSRLEFDFILPKDLGDYFDEIKKYKNNCKYSDCLHEEKDFSCAVKENLDKIDSTRYESYLRFLNETKDFKQKVTYESLKEEGGFKKQFDKNYIKLSSKKRSASRKTTKQKINTYEEEQND